MIARFRRGDRRSLRSLGANRSGLAMLEFAFSLPVVLGVGAYGMETANLALLNLRISQIALNLADNASRVGAYSTLQIQQMREVDVNDVLQAARYQGKSIDLTTNGRIILSSLENVQQTYDTAPVQRIHWQRCLGMKGSVAAEAAYNSSNGLAATSPSATYAPNATYDPNAGVDTDPTTADNSSTHPGSLAPNGMGDAGSKVNAPPASGVMFVEINYLTKPLFGTWLMSPSRIKYIASFIVRDKRAFDQIYNPVTTPATPRLTCNLYSA